MTYPLSRLVNVPYRQLVAKRLHISYKALPALSLLPQSKKLTSLVQIRTIHGINTSSCFPERFLSTRSISQLEFSELCEETLTVLSDHFEELVETESIFKSGDITYSDGVLTAFLGQDFGTYVINRQTPNQQIWLSSPTSGPKRYDYFDGQWIYKHDNTTLHELLDREIGAITNNQNSRFSSLLLKK